MQEDNVPDIYDAIQSGDVYAVEEYLHAGVPVNSMDEEGWSLLHHAAACGHVEVVLVLVKYGCCIEVSDSSGRTPLHYAVANGLVACVRVLMGCNVNALDDEQITPLQWAVMCEQYSVVEELIKHGGTVNVTAKVLPHGNSVCANVSGCSKAVTDGCNTRRNDSEICRLLDHFREGIIEAVISGNTTTVKQYLHLGIPVDLPDEGGQSPVHHAIVHRQVEVVKLLIERGCYMFAVEQRNQSSRNMSDCISVIMESIIHAVQSGDTNAVREFLDLGIPVDLCDGEDRTLLHYAAGEGHLELVKLLLDRSFSKSSVDRNGWTPSISAFACDHIAIHQLLTQMSENDGCAYAYESDLSTALFSESDFVEIDKDNSIPPDELYPNDSILFDAVCSGNTQMVNEFLSEGIPVDLTDEGGWSLLHHAAACDQGEVLLLLLEKNCAIETPDNKKCTPLHYAAAAGSVECIRYLIENGANVNSVDSEGNTPLQCSVLNEHYSAMETLIEHGGTVDASEILPSSLSPVSLGIHNNHNNEMTEVCKRRIFAAAKSGDSTLIKDYVDVGVPVDIADENGWALVHHAIANRQVNVIRLLIDRGCRILPLAKKSQATLDSEETFGTTESDVFDAARSGDTTKLKKFLDLGFSVNLADEDGRSLLHCAAGEGKIIAVKVLIENGSSVDSVDKNGWTPSMYATFQGHNDVQIVLNFVKSAYDLSAGWTPLHSAVAKGNLELVEALLSLGGKKLMTVVSGSAGTPLHLAAAGGHLCVITHLLEEGCPVDTRDANGSTALHTAICFGHVDVAEMLIVHGLDVNSVDNEGMTPLHMASTHRQLESVRTLLRLGGRCAITAVAHDGGTPLHQAAARGCKKTVALLLDAGCPPNVTSCNGITALHVAARYGRVEVIEVLVKHGLDINVLDDSELTPLHSAARHGQIRTVRSLIRLSRKSMMLVSKKLGCPLHLAAVNGHSDVIALFLSEGCPIDLRNNDGLTALHVAAHFGQPQVIEMLVKHGLDIHIADYEGSTPLHCAAGSGQLESVCTLLRLGGRRSMFVVSSEGGTPLHQAAAGGHKDVITLLLSEGCPIDVRDTDGSTAIHFATRFDQIGIIELLVKCGLDVNLTDSDDYTPLHLAAANDQMETANTLLRLGGRKSLTMVAGNKGPPLHQAAVAGHTRMISLLLDEGCPIDVKDGDGLTALHVATLSGKVNSIEKLVKRGLDVNIVDSEGKTPLHTAATHSQVESVRTLLRLGGRRALTISAGEAGTPLHQAAGKGCKTIIPLLLNSGCPIDVTTSNASTPLHFAAGGGGVDVINMLVKGGVSVNAVDAWGGTPLHHVVYRPASMRKLFLSGARITNDNYEMNVYEYMIALRHMSNLEMKLMLHACGIVCHSSTFTDVITTLCKNGLTDMSKILCLSAVSGNIDVFNGMVGSDFPLDKQRMPKLIRAMTVRSNDWTAIQNKLEELHVLDDPLNPLHVSLISCKHHGSVGGELAARHAFAERVISHPRTQYTIHELFPNGLSPLDVARQFDLHDIVGMIERAGGRPGIWADLPKELGQKSIELLKSLKELGGGEFGKDSIHAFLNMLGYRVIEERKEEEDHSVILEQKPEPSQVQRCVLSNVKVGGKWKRVGELLNIGAGVLDRLGKMSSDADEAYYSMLKYWLEYGHNVTWRTLLDAIGNFETKKTMDDIKKKMDEIFHVSVLLAHVFFAMFPQKYLVV